MEFKGFTKKDFDTFQITGLDERMEAIRERIQPKFQAIGQPLTNDLSILTGNEMYLHIAKHARRTVNPPKDTWLAIAANKRGYKQHPHFQVGVFDDHVFIWLAFIYELPRKAEISSHFLAHFDEVLKWIPKDFVISLDHTKKDAETVETMGEDGLRSALERFRDVKKAEFLVGRHIASSDPLLKNGKKFIQVTKETFETLVPLYKLAL
ncbi:YktB family protein [Bacillota bacterium Lsc_1132]